MLEMVQRRRNAALSTITGGHVVYADRPDEFCNSVKEFLPNLNNFDDNLTGQSSHFGGIRRYQKPS